MFSIQYRRIPNSELRSLPLLQSKQGRLHVCHYKREQTLRVMHRNELLQIPRIGRRSLRLVVRRTAQALFHIKAHALLPRSQKHERRQQEEADGHGLQLARELGRGAQPMMAQIVIHLISSAVRQNRKDHPSSSFSAVPKRSVTRKEAHFVSVWHLSSSFDQFTEKSTKGSS